MPYKEQTRQAILSQHEERNISQVHIRLQVVKYRLGGWKIGDHYQRKIKYLRVSRKEQRKRPLPKKSLSPSEGKKEPREPNEPKELLAGRKLQILRELTRWG
jgi:hypothetical protein